LRRLILRLVINAVALYAAVRFVPGIGLRGGWGPLKLPGPWGTIVVQGQWVTLVVMALIFGFVNALVRPLIKLLTCPLIIVTLGLFVLVINALMLWLAAWLGSILGTGFYVEGPVPALLGALIVSVVSWVLSLLLPGD